MHVCVCVLGEGRLNQNLKKIVKQYAKNFCFPCALPVCVCLCVSVCVSALTTSWLPFPSDEVPNVGQQAA